MNGGMVTMIYLAGIGTSMLIVTAVHVLRRTYAKHRQQQQRTIQDLLALQACEEHPDQIEDDRIDCPLCWEQRNPGQQWFLRSYTPCHEHTSERPGVAEEDQHSREGALQH